MLRLVTQFDDHRREVTPATPTCCCCCCCVISIATSMTYAGVDVATRPPPEGADMGRSDRIVFAVLALPIGVLVGSILGALANAAGGCGGGSCGVAGWIGFAAAIATWTGLLTLAYQPVIGSKALGRAAAIIAATAASFFVEIFVALVCLVTVIGIPVYLAAAVLVPGLVNKRLRKKRADEQRWQE